MSRPTPGRLPASASSIALKAERGRSFPFAERRRLLDQLLREVGGLSLRPLRYPETLRRRPLNRVDPLPQAGPDTDAHAGAGLMLQGAGKVGALIARQGGGA
ncbi:MAG TPA: hypothetical protein VGK45_07135 [Thermoanaerobaculia bacterium]|jgi:hypothetical protein